MAEVVGSELMAFAYLQNKKMLVTLIIFISVICRVFISNLVFIPSKLSNLHKFYR